MPDKMWTEVCVFDGSIGRDGQYTWKLLPKPMTRKEAEDYCAAADWCPPENFR